MQKKGQKADRTGRLGCVLCRESERCRGLLATGTGNLPTPSAAPVRCLKGLPTQSGITGEFPSWPGPPRSFLPELSIWQGGPGVWVTSVFAAHAIPGRMSKLCLVHLSSCQHIVLPNPRDRVR